MSHAIIQITETGEHMNRKRVGAFHRDAQGAIQALEKLLSGYPKSGRDDEQGYWWARDSEDRHFRFVITDVP